MTLLLCNYYHVQNDITLFTHLRNVGANTVYTYCLNCFSVASTLILFFSHASSLALGEVMFVCWSTTLVET